MLELSLVLSVFLLLAMLEVLSANKRIKELIKSLEECKELLQDYELLASTKQYEEVIRRKNAKEVGTLPGGKKLI